MWKSVLLLLVSAAPLGGQGLEAVRGAPSTRPVLRAAPLAGPIRVDGRFDEAAWASAEVASDFTQSYPSPGAPATQRTEVRVLVGPDALYIGARMFDTRPDSIAAQLSRRDVFGTYSDRILVNVDSRNDRRTGFHFGVNPRGVKQDAYMYDDTREDASWDAVWEVATTVDSLGWTAEFRIPFSQLRFPDQVEGEPVWGLGLMREIARSQERSSWSPWTRNSPGFVSAFGELRGLAGIRTPKRLEVLPYTSGRLERAPGDRANPFYEGNEWAGSIGADLQYGLPGGLTLTGTVNPDFGQVEVDPAEVNLTAFETFFPERRPFFVEGSDVFRFGEVSAFNTYGFSQFFYSRRVGRAPQRLLGGSEFAYADAPDQSTILAAAKVTGRTAGGWTVGIMDALTSEEEARFLGADGLRHSTPVEPLSNYFVGRVRRDLRQGNTVVGGILSSTHRRMDSGVFDGLLRSRAYVAGVDAQHRWARRTWVLSGFLAGSRVEGPEKSIATTQRSSARYFQRDDADYLRFDSTRTSLGGHMGGLALARTGSWRGSVAYQFSSPGFEINDLGFLGRVDYHAFSTQLGRRVYRPGKVFRDHSYSVSTNHAWNWGGDRIHDLWSGDVSATFTNLWNAGASVAYAPRTLNDRLTRGGPLAESPPQWRVTLQGGTDPRKRFGLSSTLTHREDTSGEYDRSVNLSASIRPSTTLQLTLGPTIRARRDTDQYVLARPDTLSSTFGRRYVFANVDQTIFALDTRLSWTFTPDLSLQLYAQPLVNSADFWDYKEFTTPGGFEFDVYGRDRGTIRTSTACGSRAGAPDVHTVDPDGSGPAGCFQLRDRDFNFRSLRGNAVLRWEYRPGSTLFLVWQQLRSGSQPFGDFDLGRDAGGILDEPARNIFLVKMTYWLSR
ncbi:MAG TPA: DUF5916 domain-containing protein [Longimicrobiaceae bacterium]|nr:DUF5916 domain-containing protein [Longimicrobiaceae bacterium]